MPYDELLNERLQACIGPREGVIEKSMFGGKAFLVHGNVSCGIFKDLLIVRVGVENMDALLDPPRVRVMDITGRPMKGWLFVEPAAHKKDADLLVWVNRSYDFASRLPRKS